MDGSSEPNGSPRRIVSIIIPAHNEGPRIGETIEAIRAQERPEIEIEMIVVDDRSVDDTVGRAESAGARVLRSPVEGGGGNPAAARNLGARASRGDPLIFLDADCRPVPGWLDAILAAHNRGEIVVGGSLALPSGLTRSARLDYYCGWYLIHPWRPAEKIPHHPPGNLSVRRDAFLSTSGFTEREPFAYSNEERHWQAELRQRGYLFWFEPKAAVYHSSVGVGKLLRRSYRWAYTAVRAKSETGSARMAWLYHFPWLTLLLSFPFAVGQSFYIVWCWARAGKFEPVLFFPGILLTRMAYAAGMTVGGFRWLWNRNRSTGEFTPKWQ